MRIAIIGAGISGLATAYVLDREHEVHVFEANDYIGGHTNTIQVKRNGEQHAIDTGFIVFNEPNYPNFAKLLNRLGVESQPTSMSFSVRCDRSGLEYNGTSINRLFAQRQNLFRRGFHRMIRDILRFQREASALAGSSDEKTVDDYVAEHGYSAEFVEHYLTPLGSALWSCPVDKFRRFPIRFVVEFLDNHSMLQVGGRPTWRVIKGGSFRYVEALTRSLRSQIRLQCPVRSVTRFRDRVEVSHQHGADERFDHAILACHSDQALALLSDPTPQEREVLGAFPYQRNDAVLHTDEAALPRKRSTWASWNYHVNNGDFNGAAVTYNMNLLQTLQSRDTFCVTLNDHDGLDASRVLERITYHHPVYTTQRAHAQQQHPQFIRANRTSFCGAYWGYGFHEDGVNSALAVCKGFGSTL